MNSKTIRKIAVAAFFAVAGIAAAQAADRAEPAHAHCGDTIYELYCPKCGHTWYSSHWDNYCPRWGCTGQPKRR